MASKVKIWIEFMQGLLRHTEWHLTKPQFPGLSAAFNSKNKQMDCIIKLNPFTLSSLANVDSFLSINLHLEHRNFGSREPCFVRATVQAPLVTSTCNMKDHRN